MTEVHGPLRPRWSLRQILNQGLLAGAGYVFTCMSIALTGVVLEGHLITLIPVLLSGLMSVVLFRWLWAYVRTYQTLIEEDFIEQRRFFGSTKRIPFRSIERVRFTEFIEECRFGCLVVVSSKTERVFFAL